MAGGIREALWMLLAAVGLLLALVLFNLGNLLLTRNTNRFREFVVREALGATPWQLFRQSFMEQILLVSSAAAISLGLAEWGVSAHSSGGREARAETLWAQCRAARHRAAGRAFVPDRHPVRSLAVAGGAELPS